MAVRTLVNFDSQAGITGTSDSFIISPARDANVAYILTSGTPTTGARVQITLDDSDKIASGTANWVNSPLGAKLVSSGENVLRPVTGVRLSVTDGTWTFNVRQG